MIGYYLRIQLVHYTTDDPVGRPIRSDVSRQRYALSKTAHEVYENLKETMDSLPTPRQRRAREAELPRPKKRKARPPKP